MKISLSLPVLTMLLLAMLCLTSCASTRTPIAPGVVPQQTHSVSAEDEDYGHQVLAQLTRQYPLDRDDQRINRVRDIVSRLADAAGSSHNPWHSYVLLGNDVKNAAATKGNMVFVWTGMLKAVQDDDELATIMAHEMAHILAGHTQPDPAEAANQMISGIAGVASREVLLRGTRYGAFAELAELLVSGTVRGLILNPELQRIELEADQVGLFLMADAGYDPAKAVTFWSRVEADPSFRGAPVQFLSSHPSSAIRLEQLKANLPAAQKRYQAATGRTQSSESQLPASRSSAVSQNLTPSGHDTVLSTSSFREPPKPIRANIPSDVNQSPARWVVMEPSVTVHARADASSRVTGELKQNSFVQVRSRSARWLEIDSPLNGFVQSRYLAPADY